MTTLLQLEPEQRQVLDTEVSPLLEKAQSLEVKTPTQRLSALEFVKTLRAMKEKIEQRFHPTRNREDAYDHYKMLKETENAFYVPIDGAVEVVTKTIKSFDTSEALKIQQQAQLAEAKRLQDEREAREKLERQAAKQAARGNTEKAEALLEQAETVTVAPSFAPAPASVKKLVWKAKVTNLFQLCKAIGEGRVPFTVIEVKISGLNSWAKGHDGKNKIDGLEFYQETERI